MLYYTAVSKHAHSIFGVEDFYPTLRYRTLIPVEACTSGSTEYVAQRCAISKTERDVASPERRLAPLLDLGALVPCKKRD